MILPGKDDATYHTQEIYSRDRSKRFFHAPPLTVYHAGDCSSTPTLHVELPLHIENGIVLGGDNMTLGERLARIEATLENATAAATSTSSGSSSTALEDLAVPPCTLSHRQITSASEGSTLGAFST
eukprot:840801-Prymnesium_polylepis.1